VKIYKLILLCYVMKAINFPCYVFKLLFYDTNRIRCIQCCNFTTIFAPNLTLHKEDEREEWHTSLRLLMLEVDKAQKLLLKIKMIKSIFLQDNSFVHW